jgi:F/Y-rich N-terminus
VSGRVAMCESVAGCVHPCIRACACVREWRDLLRIETDVCTHVCVLMCACMEKLAWRVRSPYFHRISLQKELQSNADGRSGSASSKGTIEKRRAAKHEQRAEEQQKRNKKETHDKKKNKKSKRTEKRKATSQKSTHTKKSKLVVLPGRLAGERYHAVPSPRRLRDSSLCCCACLCVCVCVCVCASLAVDVAQDGSLSSPLQLGATMQVITLGKICTRPGFHSNRYLYPIGFASLREFSR